MLRGFALLGILLMNILSFGLPSSQYMIPAADSSALDLWVWSVVDVSAEGAMRCLFSILFGAGVVLFTSGTEAKSASLHYKRTFWLLCFGLLDVFLLLWVGDILVVYALCGFILYWFRNANPRNLLIAALALITLMSLQNAGMHYGMSELAATNNDEWQATLAGMQPDQATIAAELAERTESYASAWLWSANAYAEILTFVLPFILFWDALAMMLLGMALYKYGVLQGNASPRFYVGTLVVGLGVGLGLNISEVMRSQSSNFDVLASFPYFQWSYHLGRLSMAMGWMSLIILVLSQAAQGRIIDRLAAVGRMALTNYLMHSLIMLFIFTGAGLGLVGELSRAGLYLLVLGVWVLQLWFSPWWLARNRFGPVEWLWRGLTYGQFPENRRAVAA